MITNEQILNYKNIVIFGAGSGHIIKYLINTFGGRITMIIDNDSKKYGMYENIEVCSPERLNGFEKNETIIISSLYFDEPNEAVKKQITKMGWGENFYIARHELECVNTYEYKLFEDDTSANNFMPVTLTIEISSFCNCKCIYCPYHGKYNPKFTGHKQNISWDTVHRIAEQAKNISSLKTLLVVGTGETFIDTEWFEKIQYILDETRLNSIRMYTNGMLLNAANIDKIMNLNAKDILVEISIDGRTPEDNDRYRVGSKYETIKSNINILREKIKSNTEKDISIMITNCYPIHKGELEDGDEHLLINQPVPEYLKKDFPDIYSVSKNTYILPKDNGEDDDYGAEYVHVVFPRNVSFNKCDSPFDTITVDSLGNLLRCGCGNLKDKYIGNIADIDMLKEWLNDRKLNEIRKGFIDGKVSELCYNCACAGIGDYYLMVEE